MSAYDVEVFPVEPTRWIAVIEGPLGLFSTETTAPELIVDEVHSSIREVLDDATPTLRLVDEDGRPWTVESAAAQLAGLDDR